MLSSFVRSRNRTVCELYVTIRYPDIWQFDSDFMDLLVFL